MLDNNTQQNDVIQNTIDNKPLSIEDDFGNAQSLDTIQDDYSAKNIGNDDNKQDIISLMPKEIQDSNGEKSVNKDSLLKPEQPGDIENDTMDSIGKSDSDKAAAQDLSPDLNTVKVGEKVDGNDASASDVTTAQPADKTSSQVNEGVIDKVDNTPQHNINEFANELTNLMSKFEDIIINKDGEPVVINMDINLTSYPYDGYGYGYGCCHHTWYDMNMFPPPYFGTWGAPLYPCDVWGSVFSPYEYHGF